MAENGYCSGPVAGYVGRIPNFGKTNVNPMGSVEPPACIQNAMMTKDKKPFTYTPGGLDLSQIRTPSMARRMAKQRSWEDHDQSNNASYHVQGGPHGGVPQGSGPQGGAPPPPPPPKVPMPPPPPPPIVIQAPNSKSSKPIALGERPEIVIPENPIGMLRKTNSPYHWEVEKAELQKLGQVPKYVEKEVKPKTPQMDTNTAPWRTNTLNRYPRASDSQQNVINNQSTNEQEAYSPPWKHNDGNNKNNENTYVPSWKQDKSQQQQQQYSPPWVNAHDNNNKVQEIPNTWRSQEVEQSPCSKQEQPRYQSTISIPVTPKKNNTQPEYNTPQKEAVYVNQEPVYYCPDSPKSIPRWVKTQKEKTKTPPPVWCQRSSDGSKNVPRELTTPPRETYSEPEWVKKSNDIQRGGRDIISPPKFQQQAQPTWSTKPSENRKSLPKENTPNTPGSRIIPIQMEVTTNESRDAGKPVGNQHPQLRITIGMSQNSNDQAGVPFSPPTQRIMRVLSPQLVKLDDGETHHELPSLNRSFQNHDTQPKTRIIPIQIEGGDTGAKKSFGGRY